jgi:hypothetical protein
LAFSLPTKVLSRIARFRWQHRFFRFPWDYTVPAWGLEALNTIGVSGKLRGAMWKP